MTEQPPVPRRGVPEGTPSHRSPFKIMATVIFAIVIISSWLLHDVDRTSIKALVVVPQLNAIETKGQAVFAQHCTACHGANGEGDSEIGPPLIHPYYRAKMLSVDQIRRAILLGTPQDKWKYGHMPAQIELSEAEIDQVIAFFDALRNANSLGGD